MVTVSVDKLSRLFVFQKDRVAFVGCEDVEVDFVYCLRVDYVARLSWR